ncbi:MAG: prephenate dehydrogenase/arogenate dehydrogenase family protein [Deltaproteobacteria bacterium]|nr:prephenate dehydrogenase/arogenate dehydrogenase family protein [Deltaproteobacteria bacterium]
MTTFATLGPQGSDSYQAVGQYRPGAKRLLYNRISDIITSFSSGNADFALIPVYNTREGEVKEYFRLMEKLDHGYWVDNIVLPINLSLGAQTPEITLDNVELIIGRSSVFRQCEEYIGQYMPQATLVSVSNLERAIIEFKRAAQANQVLIESEQIIKRSGLHLIDRELAPYNRTRFAVIGNDPHAQSGYDATSIITRPLPDRVGLLVDTLNEFTRRGINILDLRSENDIKTQKLQIYIEAEGHQDGTLLSEALQMIENSVIQEKNCIKILGSFPRVDMRVKKIKSFGFIGTGDMSIWFAKKLGNEGYKTIITGRRSEIRPEDMIEKVDVVVICVPISVTSQIIKRYGHLLREGQALILLAGESENPLDTALEHTIDGVEIMLVHNLWGPQTLIMKDKNVAVIRTRRSGSLCSEFESFLYKYGAEIYLDSPDKHDLLMGVGQKLPTSISVALAMTLNQHQISCEDIDSHSTLTSLYGVLAMARVHYQNARTYAEIMATSGEGRKIVSSFIKNLQKILDLAEARRIDELCTIIEQNKENIPSAFLKTKMEQAQAVDAVLSDVGFKGM